jgi:uncharacterized membrane protein (DUF4010 family)
VDIFQQLPPDLVKISLVLFLSFLVGLEREEHKATANSYSFGGVRTFPLIGLIGYSLALLSGNQLLPLTIGFMVVAGFLLLSYWHKLCKTETPGVTSEMSALAIFLIGALVCYGHLWIATTLGVASLLLLDLKQALENLSARIAPSEILTFAKFLVLTGVILPVLPHQEFSRFHINPFKTWLVVVAISAISYGSYVLQKLTKGRGGIELAALLGGAYSSTVTTVVMARRAAREHRPQLFAGSILIASGVMYLRLIILLALFNRQLMSLLWMPFLAFAALAIGGGWLWTRRADANAQAVQREFEPKNPLELMKILRIAVALLLASSASMLLAQTPVPAKDPGAASIDRAPHRRCTPVAVSRRDLVPPQHRQSAFRHARRQHPRHDLSRIRP